MKIYARTRTPDGSLVRANYGGMVPSEGVQAIGPVLEVQVESDPSAGLTWWDRWCLLGALEQPEYQRLF